MRHFESEDNRLEYDLQQALHTYFGYSVFRDEQKTVIKEILDGHHVLAVFPTGWGKSLCFQLPVFMKGWKAVIISPLKALIEDQVNGLKKIGLAAAYVHGELSPKEQIEIIHSFSEPMIRTFSPELACQLLYITPECFIKYYRDLFQHDAIQLVVFDEAHCLVEWGEGFRPKYKDALYCLRDIFLFYNKNSLLQVAAFTATATLDMKDRLLSLLNTVIIDFDWYDDEESYKIEDKIKVISGPIDRPNLSFQIYHMVSTEEKMSFILRYLEDESHRNHCGIIYCATRKDTRTVAEFLKTHLEGILVDHYHAGLEIAKQIQIRKGFLQGKVQVLVATNAFGLGINKEHIRFVIHYQMPGSIEAYYQEAGRAGRDGKEADCILLYSPKDVGIQKKLIATSIHKAKEAKRRQETMSDYGDELDRQKKEKYRKLQDVLKYCYTAQIPARYFRRYFEEDRTGTGTPPIQNLCLLQRSGKDSNLEDMTREALIVLQLIAFLSEKAEKWKENTTILIIAQILKGVPNPFMAQDASQHIPAYRHPLFSEWKIEEVYTFIYQLWSDQYIVLKQIWSNAVFCLSSKGKAVLKNKEPVRMWPIQTQWSPIWKKTIKEKQSLEVQREKGSTCRKQKFFIGVVQELAQGRDISIEDIGSLSFSHTEMMEMHNFVKENPTSEPFWMDFSEYLEIWRRNKTEEDPFAIGYNPMETFTISKLQEQQKVKNTLVVNKKAPEPYLTFMKQVLTQMAKRYQVSDPRDICPDMVVSQLFFNEKKALLSLAPVQRKQFGPILQNAVQTYKTLFQTDQKERTDE